MLASADTFEARLRFGRFVGMVSSEENTYFLRAFQALGVTESRRAVDPDAPPTAGFKAIMREAAETRSYAAALSVLVVAEWLYLDWASRAPKPLQTTSCTPSGLHCTTTRTFAASSISSAQSWTGSAQHMRTCAATSFAGLLPSNSPSSKPPTPIETDTVLVCPQLGSPAGIAPDYDSLGVFGDRRACLRRGARNCSPY